MSTKRILDEQTASVVAPDDYLYIDGATNNSRKITPENVVRNTTVAQNLATHIAEATEAVDELQDAIDGLSNDIGDLANLETTDKSSLVGAINEAAQSGGSGSGLTEDVKQALLDCFENVAWINDDGQTYYDALEDALYPPADLVSISAVYSGGNVYNTATLDDLKPNLVVTAHMSDSTTQTITTYVLSGTIATGSQTITVTYGGKTTTFTITVVEWLTGITATYTQSGTVYDTDSLDDLKADLVVTATYADSTSETITDYTLSGTLEEGTSTITVAYGGKTATFNVTVSMSRTTRFGTFVNGHAVSKANGAISDIPDRATYIASMNARAAFSTPIVNMGTHSLSQIQVNTILLFMTSLTIHLFQRHIQQ